MNKAETLNPSALPRVFIVDCIRLFNEVHHCSFKMTLPVRDFECFRLLPIHVWIIKSQLFTCLSSLPLYIIYDRKGNNPEYTEIMPNIDGLSSFHTLFLGPYKCVHRKKTKHRRACSGCFPKCLLLHRRIHCHVYSVQISTLVFKKKLVLLAL